MDPKQTYAQLGEVDGRAMIIFRCRFDTPQMKDIGARKNSRLNAWVMFPLVSNVKQILRRYPNTELSPHLRNLLESSTGYILRKDVREVLSEATLAHAKPYQLECLQRGYNSPHGAYMFQLGKRLGKSFTSIAFAEAKKAERILVVCGKTIMEGWQKEIRLWANEEAVISHGTLPAEDVRWNITNYETLRNYDYANGYEWDLVIFDESVLLQHRGATKVHKWKDGEKIEVVARQGTGRTDDAAELRDSAKFILLLSGAPTSKHADGLYPQFHLAFPKYFTSYWRFVNTYCEVEVTKWGTKIIGTKSDIDFQDEFKDLWYSVRTEDVFDVQIEYEQIDLELTENQANVYDQLMQEFEAELNGATISAQTKLARAIRFAQTVSNLANLGPGWGSESCKLDWVVENINDNVEKPCIIWVHWKETARYLFSQLSSAGFRTGIYTGDKKSLSAIEKFQGGEIDILVLSLTTGKHGLTIPARTMIYYDKIWDGDAYDQSLMRAMDVTQQVNDYKVITLFCPGTADELIAANLEGKMVSLSSITDEDLIRLLGGLKHGETN